MRAADEIFVSDGSKCDIARIQMMFGAKATVAVQVWIKDGRSVNTGVHYAHRK